VQVAWVGQQEKEDNYGSIIAASVLERAILHQSYFPGDLSVEVSLPGRVPLLVVELNSAWLQYDDRDYEGRLALPSRQFQAALPHRMATRPWRCSIRGAAPCCSCTIPRPGSSYQNLRRLAPKLSISKKL
jgi:hypothetical protein